MRSSHRGVGAECLAQGRGSVENLAMRGLQTEYVFKLAALPKATAGKKVPLCRTVPLRRVPESAIQQRRIPKTFWF